MTHIRSHLLAALAAAGFLFATAPAFAQASGCQEGQKILQERQGLIQQVNKLTNGGKNKQIDPRAACTIFTKLVANGTTGEKWMTANKDWCQVPDQLIQSFAEDHKRSQQFKGQACGAPRRWPRWKSGPSRASSSKAAAAAGKMGGGLTGTLSVPKGAL